MLFSQVVYHLPVFVVCVIGGVMLLGRRPQLGVGATWALAGVGLKLALCVIQPIVTTALQVWLIHGQNRPQQAGLIFSVMSILWAIMHAASYALVLAGVLAVRNKTGA